VFLYESHLGGYFASEEELEWEGLYCETCGDSDYLVGEYETKEEREKLLMDELWGYEDEEGET